MTTTTYSAAGVPSLVPLSTANPGLGRFLFAVFGIPFGLCMVVLTGSELVTSNFGARIMTESRDAASRGARRASAPAVARPARAPALCGC
jgi:formate/nitrite transporter FocA (FNT family)